MNAELRRLRNGSDLRFSALICGECHVFDIACRCFEAFECRTHAILCCGRAALGLHLSQRAAETLAALNAGACCGGGRRRLAQQRR